MTLPDPPVFVGDSSALLHGARSDRLDVLLADASRVFPGVEHVTTRAVMEEVRRLGGAVADAMPVVHVDGLDEMTALGPWLQRLASGVHNRGEVTVCAWAEVHGAVVIMDDQPATRVGRTHGLTFRGTPWICGKALDAGLHTPASVSAVVEALTADGARLPCSGRDFPSWWSRNRPP